jgi:hypothetical protein
MTYSTSAPPRAVFAGRVNAGPMLWIYSEASAAAAAIDASGYITNGGALGMRVGDLVLHLNVATGIWSGHTVMTVSSTAPGAVDLSNGTTIADGSSNSD